MRISDWSSDVCSSDLLESQIEGAIASGTYDVGVETLIAESFAITERRTVYTHAATGAETRSYRVRRKDRNRPLGLDAAHKVALRHHGELIVNPVSNRAAEIGRAHV